MWTDTAYGRKPNRAIRAIVRVKEKDTTLPDREDLAFTANGRELVDAFDADAGIFTVGRVCRLPYTTTGVDRQTFQGDRCDLPGMLARHRPRRLPPRRAPLRAAIPVSI